MKERNYAEYSQAQNDYYDLQQGEEVKNPYYNKKLYIASVKLEISELARIGAADVTVLERIEDSFLNECFDDDCDMSSAADMALMIYKKAA